MLWLWLAGCVHWFEPVLLAPSAQPIPEGLVATDPELVEATACGSDYHGLGPLLERAKQGSDGLVQVTVEIEQTISLFGSKPRCVVVRAYRVTYRTAQ